ncbi:MAG TPA: YetF domain-containing protein [Rhodothermales bacterium]|nr:YetF domain-containing protein [Rhodothermales bacterium]
MVTIFRGLFTYALLLVVFRIAGKRTLAQTTNFDLVLLLIISETTQQMMVDNDHSFTNGTLLVVTLVGASIVLSFLKQRYKSVERWVEGLPLIVLENGVLDKGRLQGLRMDEQDILEAARRLQGIERLEQIKYAVVERNGEITVIPRAST